MEYYANIRRTGMDRSAFHSDATVGVDGTESAYVSFDSSAFFGH